MSKKIKLDHKAKPKFIEDEEIESDSGDDDDNSMYDDEDDKITDSDNDETAQEKKIRLAKSLIEQIKKRNIY
jgi:hypothetical protein